MTYEISTIPLPLPFNMGIVNCYLIKTTKGFVLIDTGNSTARKELLEQLKSAGCKRGDLKLVILTHGDFDHIGNAAFLRSAFETRLAMHRDDSEMAERGDMFVNRKKPNFLIKILIPIFTGFRKSEFFIPDIHLNDQDDLSQYGLVAQVLSLPGHSRGSIGILTINGDLFCGDLFENIKKPMINSIMDDVTTAGASAFHLKSLNVKMVFPGHGQPFTMDLITK